MATNNEAAVLSLSSIIITIPHTTTMSPVDNNKEESPSLCNLARIDTSNDWSDLESLGSLHSPSRPHLFSSHTKRDKSIEVIPSTPNGGYLSNDEEVTSLRELDSIMVPSSTESETTIDIDEPFASFVISVTNLDDEGTQTQEWETTLLGDNTTTTDVASQAKPPSESSSERRSTIKTNAAPRGQTIHTSSNNKNTTTAALKPVIRPRQPAVSALDKENNTTIPLRRTSGHRRVGYNSLPSPRDLEEHGVEMSYTSKEATQNTKQQQRAHQKKHAWTHRRKHKVLNATTGFR
jgi:hypothetical protein